MTLIINNDDVARLLTIEATMDALEQSYRNLAIGEATCRPAHRHPDSDTSDPARTYQFGSMEVRLHGRVLRGSDEIRRDL